MDDSCIMTKGKECNNCNDCEDLVEDIPDPTKPGPSVTVLPTAKCTPKVVPIRDSSKCWRPEDAIKKALEEVQEEEPHCCIVILTGKDSSQTLISSGHTNASFIFELERTKFNQFVSYAEGDFEGNE